MCRHLSIAGRWHNKWSLPKKRLGGLHTGNDTFRHALYHALDHALDHAFDHSYVQPAMQCAMQCGMQSCMHAVDSTESEIQSDVQATEQPEVHSLPCPTRKGRCAQGFSDLQINILCIIRGYRDILAYWQVADIVMYCFGMPASEGSVRGAMARLSRRGFLVRERGSKGRIQGNCYALNREPCPLIPSWKESMQSEAQPDVHSAINGPLSSLKDKIDRKDLSISDEKTAKQCKLQLLDEKALAFHWPELARQGFGMEQIGQIIKRLEQIDVRTDKVISGLHHSEWALENGCMKDAKGEPVGNPVNWVFSILARQGYYPRPPGYVSPEEKMEQDAAIEAERLQKARQARLKADFAFWVEGLSPEDRESIAPEKDTSALPPEVRMIPAVRLELYFKEHVWPGLQQRKGDD
jgi:hypothetical protein